MDTDKGSEEKSPSYMMKSERQESSLMQDIIILDFFEEKKDYVTQQGQEE